MPKDPDAIPFFVLGNKVDLENERKVARDRVSEWLKINPEIIYYETSALDGSNVAEAFSKIAQNFLNLQSDGMSTAPGTSVSGQEHSIGSKKFDVTAQ